MTTITPHAFYAPTGGNRDATIVYERKQQPTTQVPQQYIRTTVRRYVRLYVLRTGVVNGIKTAGFTKVSFPAGPPQYTTLHHSSHRNYVQCLRPWLTN